MKRTCHITADNDHPCTVCGAPFKVTRRRPSLRAVWRSRRPSSGRTSSLIAGDEATARAVLDQVASIVLVARSRQAAG